MTKAELVDKVAVSSGMPKSEVAKIINITFDYISRALSEGQHVMLVGFGTFSVTQRKERIGRNPKTGQSMTIAATKVPVFRAGKNLKESISGVQER
jgi:DNA-binding protein HU-beta